MRHNNVNFGGFAFTLVSAFALLAVVIIVGQQRCAGVVNAVKEKENPKVCAQ